MLLVLLNFQPDFVYLCLGLINFTILSSLINIDKQLFLFLNGFHSPFFDDVFYFITDRFSWVPFYLFLTILLFFKYKWKGFVFLPFVAMVILLSDQISVQLFKEVFMRLRPCHNPEIKDLVHTVDGCGGLYGFVSSHASNTFALALFVGLILKKHVPKLLPILVCWAAIVSYSRIYVGVHYPADIIGGAILGLVIAFTVWKVLLYINQYFNLKLTVS